MSGPDDHRFATDGYDRFATKPMPERVLNALAHYYQNHPRTPEIDARNIGVANDMIDEELRQLPDIGGEAGVRWLREAATAGSIGLGRVEILEARRAHQADGPRSKAIHRRLGVSESTLIRHRHALGLVPWPED